MALSRLVASVALALTATALVPSCQSADSAPPAPTCNAAVLFGRPAAKTGLGDDMCQPRCACQAVPFEAPLYGQTDIDALGVWTLLEGPAPLTADPYASPAPAAGPADEVCAVLPDAAGSHSYRLRTYPSQSAARDAGAITTHFGACGACSSLANLAVYMRYNDLTAPVRDCGVKGFSGDAAAQLACIEALGFEHACAQIWSYNTDHTRTACLDVCLTALGATYNLPDGTLNPCLQCDEDKSGPVFKAVAGRTRRNTGLANALCRPCSEVKPLVHRY